MCGNMPALKLIFFLIEGTDDVLSKVSTGEKSLLYPLFEMSESIYWNIKNS